ncbi:hypothetical protein JCM10908_006377 [Rhodotorula pacifica]|uniref:uncharacterized protein n=1 Tax=Rhodotorula pacifica TaxID=1495444 RepID=UPI00317362C7
MTRSTPDRPDSPRPVEHTLLINDRTNERLPISYCPRYVTAAGPASQVTLAAIITQTFDLLVRDRFSHLAQRSIGRDNLRFGELVGINLLRRYAGLWREVPEGQDNAYFDLHNLGLPGRSTPLVVERHPHLNTALQHIHGKQRDQELAQHLQHWPFLRNAVIRRLVDGMGQCPRGDPVAEDFHEVAQLDAVQERLETGLYILLPRCMEGIGEHRQPSWIEPAHLLYVYEETLAPHGTIPSHEIIAQAVPVPVLQTEHHALVDVRVYAAKWLAVIALQLADVARQSLLGMPSDPSRDSAQESRSRARAVHDWMLALFELVLLYRLHLDIQSRQVPGHAPSVQHHLASLFGIPEAARLCVPGFHASVYEALRRPTPTANLDPPRYHDEVILLGSSTECADAFLEWIRSECKVQPVRGNASTALWLQSLHSLAKGVLDFLHDEVSKPMPNGKLAYHHRRWRYAIREKGTDFFEIASRLVNPLPPSPVAQPPDPMPHYEGSETPVPGPQQVAHHPRPVTIRTDRALPIAEAPGYVAVQGPASQVIVAAIIQQTYLLHRQDMTAAMRDHFAEDQIKFTSFVGINLLRRYCQETGSCLRMDFQTTPIGTITKPANSMAALHLNSWTHLHDTVFRRLDTAMRNLPRGDVLRRDWPAFTAQPDVSTYLRIAVAVPAPRCIEGEDGAPSVWTNTLDATYVQIEERTPLGSQDSTDAVVGATVRLPPLGRLNSAPVEVYTYRASLLALQALRRMLDAERELAQLMHGEHPLAPEQVGVLLRSRCEWLVALIELAFLYRLHLEVEARPRRNNNQLDGRRAAATLADVSSAALDLNADHATFNAILESLSNRQHRAGQPREDCTEFAVNGSIDNSSEALTVYLLTACKIDWIQPFDPAVQQQWEMSITRLARQVLEYLTEQLMREPSGPGANLSDDELGHGR